MKLFLEGNIGVGKSSFLELVQNYLPAVKVSFEKNDEFMKGECGQTLLDKFYCDSKRWAYTMEVVAMMSRVRLHLKDHNEVADCRIVERSVYSGHYCFAKNGFEQGFMVPEEWHAYMTWVNLIYGQCQPPDGFIYLRATPEICFKRILKRKRQSESDLTVEYLEQLHKKHDEFLLEKKNIDDRILSIPVLTLDCSKSFVEDKNIAVRHLKDLCNFLQQLTGADTFKDVKLSEKIF